MKPKEKAIEIYNKMDWFTVGYIGSSMLTNTEFDEQKIKNTKAAAMVVVDEVLRYSSPKNITMSRNGLTDLEFWNAVKIELNNL